MFSVVCSFVCFQLKGTKTLGKSNNRRIKGKVPFGQVRSSRTFDRLRGDKVSLPLQESPLVTGDWWRFRLLDFSLS